MKRYTDTPDKKINKKPYYPKTKIIEEKKAPFREEISPEVKDTSLSSNGVVESIVAMLNQILQEITSLQQKFEKKQLGENVSIPRERKVILEYDNDGKITGAKVLDIEDK